MSKENKILLRKNIILDGGIKEEGNVNNIIPFENMSLQVGTSDPSNVIIPSLDEVIRISNELKETIFDTKYTADVPASTGITVLPTAAELNADYDAGGISAKELDGTLVLLKRTADGTEQFPVKQVLENEGLLIILEANGIFEEAGFQNNQWMIDQTKNQLPQELIDLQLGIDKNVNDINALDTRVTTLETNKANSFLNTTNDKNVLGYGALQTDGSVTEGNKLALRSEIASPLAGLKQEADANKIVADLTKGRVDIIEPIVTSNKSSVDDYNNNKADFLRLEDITTTIEVDIVTPLTMTEDGQDIVADLTSLSSSEQTILESFINGRLITIQATPNDPTSFPTEYARDSWNNGMATANVILGRDVTVQTNWTADTVTPILREIRLSGLNNQDRTNFINDFTITALSQISGAAGANIDAVARTTASSAQTTADVANAQATTNTTNIAANTTNIAAKQDKIDNAIADTTTKSTTGAINNLITKTDNMITRADNNESDVDELNLGNFDVKGDGTKITEIFDANGDLKQSIIDLGINGLNLTTQDEIYNAVELNKIYIMETGELARAYQKTSTSLSMSALIFLASGQLASYYFRADKGSAAALIKVVLTPGGDSDLVNKKYVDDKINTDMVVTFDDGTTGTYKVGK